MTDQNTLYDKIYGCWLGKNIGGTLGAPVEGQKNPVPLPFEFPDKNEPNDDLDLQLVWLARMRKKGIRLEAKDFADSWLENITYPFDEYGIAKANLERGLQPPLTGRFNNYFSDCMGSPIRSEIWGCIAAGMPASAAYYALQDAQADHGLEGICGEIFFAVVESLAFEEKDLTRLTEAGLAYLPENSEVARAIRETLSAHASGVPLNELRGALIAKYDRGNFSDAILNLAFTVAGMLYENADFLRSMVTAVNLGYDTDCTGATAGAILGIIHGADALKKQYAGMTFDNRVIAGWGIQGVETPDSLEQLTEWTLELNAELRKNPDPPVCPAPCPMPVVPDGQLGLCRSFRIVCAGSFEEAERSADWKTVFTKSDLLDLTPYRIPGKKIYVSAVVRNPSKRTVRIIPHAAGRMECRFDGVDAGEESDETFAPSPHRHWNAPHKTLVIPENGCTVLIGIEPGSASGKTEFSLMVAREENKLHEINAEISAE